MERRRRIEDEAGLARWSGLRCEDWEGSVVVWSCFSNDLIGYVVRRMVISRAVTTTSSAHLTMELPPNMSNCIVVNSVRGNKLFDLLEK